MKCVMYISKVATKGGGAAVPSGLSDIYMKARRFNATYDITGILSFKNGHYLQIIEGHKASVNQLLSNIQADPRHESVKVLIDTAISERSFPRNNMRLVISTQQDREVISFFSRYAHAIASLPKYELDLVRKFYTSVKLKSKNLNFYEGKSLTLTSWPDFNIVEQTPTVVELSALLTTGVRAYSDLLSNIQFNSSAELDTILDQFNALDILAIRDQPRALHLNNNPVEMNSFYSKMKTFLRLGLS